MRIRLDKQKTETTSEQHHMKLAQAYVPWQTFDKTFSPKEALQKGTLFPELYRPYH